MAKRIRTIDFLPEIFQTNTNDQFLSATLDQLVQPPDFRKVQGYIGSKFGYGVKTTDQYVTEPTTDKTNYQLEPTVVFTDSVTGRVTDAITYPGLIDAIKLESGIRLNHNNLFTNEFYSWDSFVDLDKLINFGQYYWVPEGPESVDITTSTVLENATIKVISNVNSYQFEVNGELLPTENPTLTLVRGGTYVFEVDEQSKFWIQSLPGTKGVDPNKTNFSTREVTGIDTNGISSGTFTYNVPAVDAQDNYTFPGRIPIDLVTTLKFNEVNGAPFNTLKKIDGVVDVQGKTLLFYGSNPNERVPVGDFFDSAAFDSTTTSTPGFNGSVNLPVTGTVFKITLIGDPQDPVIKLEPTIPIADNTNIVINSGVEFIGRTFVKNSYGEIKLIPPITATLSSLYYQDESNLLKFGKITLIDKPIDAIIDVSDILGKKRYRSPNGIEFSNGLRVRFVGRVFPTEFLNDTYYVEGVGTSIQLIPSNELIVPELYSQAFNAPFDDINSGFDQTGFSDVINLPYTPDYITISRNSLDRNGWSRGNRWFHVDVLKTIAANNTLSPITNKALSGKNRATRPIIEFYPNLKLIYHGNFGKAPVDYIDTTTTDALNMVNGSNPNSYFPDGKDSGLFDGCRIIFANDINSEVVNKIFVATIAPVKGSRVITLTKASDGDIKTDDQIVIVNGTTNKGYNYYYNGNSWVNSQTKTTVNQAPLFDVYDTNGISFSDGNYYNGTDFKGCTLFQYSIGSGVKDPVLGIPIQYSGVGNLNDINFEATLNSATFNFVYNNQSVNEPVNSGYVYQYLNKTDYVRKLGWETAVDTSFQYQIFNFTYYNNTTNNFKLDVPLKDSSTTAWPTCVVYVNNSRISDYTINTSENKTDITITPTLTPGDAITIMAYSDSISNVGYYQIPSNLQQNPFNYQITTINAGDIRGHYKSICNNIPGLAGHSFGANNYRDLGNPVPYGTRIIQNSATMVTPAAFLRKQETNFFGGLNYNATEYVKFKSLLLNNVNTQDYTPYDSASDMLDDVLDIIASSKSQSSPFFWSDMLPSKTPAVVNSYKFAIGISNTVYPLSKVYSFTVANYESILVYVSKLVNGIMQYTQLIKNVDYSVNPDEPYLVISTQLEDGDTITVKEYNQTYGNFVPNTPTKIGLYPKFIPEVILDETYLRPTYFIKGHDGSLTRLYDGFNEYGNLIDFRDKVLFEFECRIYNNIKVNAKLPLTYSDIFPGQFRTTNNTYDEVMQLYTTSFLNWVGLNRIDIASQYYDSNNEYTWNYRKSKNKLDNTFFNQGNWRGIYIWFYDTATPHATPWEMLGLPVKPVWWDERYGLGPYTSDNSLLWTDLSQGFIYNNGNPIIDNRYKRPDLLKILPVNTKGELLSPFETVVGNYNVKGFQSDWVTGDAGPAEYSYLKSSTWPFDLIRMFALLKPAQFFTLGLDLDVYKYNYEFNQYLVYDRFRTTGRQQLNLYGHDANSAAHSYMNWIVDYLYQYGLDGTTIIENLITFIDIRLSYRVSGYTDKNKINFYIEKGSPNSTNSSLVVPDDSYSILQYSNEPNDTIVYSSVIIQKTDNGYKVYGNSQNKTYFVSNVPSGTRQRLITVLDLQVYVDSEFSKQVQYTTYGHEFVTVTELANFILGYGSYLVNQGVVFDDVENNTVLDWNQMVAEMLYWVRTGWEVGSVINLNPCSNMFHVENPTGIIQPFTLRQNNFILNQNLIPINLNDLSIYRKDTTFKAKVLTNGDTISYLRADTSIIEHIVIFDNETVFNDILYNLITGLRQQRLYVKGNKTNQWDGTLYAPGFIQNENNVVDWKENTKYNKGTIVIYKHKYWMANKTVIVPSNVFTYSDWLLTNYDKIDTGLLANPNTRASESEYYYDVRRSNIQNDGDLLGFSLIGYRSRSYLSDADLDDVSQVNIYKNMIAEKGTLDIANSFQGATIQNNDLSYTINENWAIKNSEYGGVLNHNFVEFTLDESLLTGNPAILSLTNGNQVDIAQQQVQLYNIKNYGRSVTSPNILPVVSDTSITSLPSAGYVSLDDVTLYSYTVDRINNTDINLVYKNDYIWIADKQNDWGVYTPIGLEYSIDSLINNLNDTCTLVFSDMHELVQYDVIGIIDSGIHADLNGFYTIQQILSNTSVSINLSLPSNITVITFNQPVLLYKFVSMRISSPKDVNNLPLLNFEYNPLKVWVDQTASNNWALYQKFNNYSDIGFEIFDINNKTLGGAVAYLPKLGYYVSDPGAGKVYKYVRAGTGDLKTSTITHGVGYGTAMANSSEFMIVSEPGDTISKLYVYRIVSLPEVSALVEEQTIEVTGTYVGSSLAFSGDSNYIFAGAPKINSVFYFHRKVDYTLLPVLGSKQNTPLVCQLITPTKPSEKFFVVDGNAVTSIPEGKRITFLQYKQLNTCTIVSIGYEAQPGYTLQQAKDATIDPSTGKFGTDRRQYYITISGFSGSITDPIHLSIDPTVDNTDYIITSSNSVYNSGIVKFYVNQYIIGLTYDLLFDILDIYKRDSLSGVNIPIWTYNNLLPSYVTVLTSDYVDTIIDKFTGDGTKTTFDLTSTDPYGVTRRTSNLPVTGGRTDQNTTYDYANINVKLFTNIELEIRNDTTLGQIVTTTSTEVTSSMIGTTIAIYDTLSDYTEHTITNIDTSVTPTAITLNNEHDGATELGRFYKLNAKILWPLTFGYVVTQDTITFNSSLDVNVSIEVTTTIDRTIIHTIEPIDYNISVSHLFGTVNNTGTGSTYRLDSKLTDGRRIAANNVFINTVNNEFSLISYFNMSQFDRYYLGKNPGDLVNSDNTTLQQTDDNFGASIAVNYDASKIFIGSPTYHVRLTADQNVPPAPNVGIVWVFDRLIETIQLDYTPDQLAIPLPWALESKYIPHTTVSLNGKFLSSKSFKVGTYRGSPEFIFNKSLNIKAGDIITISTPSVVLMQGITSYEGIEGVKANIRFGTSLSCNSTGSELLVGTPYDHSVEGQEGAVYRFTNEAKRYGYATALISANLQPSNIGGQLVTTTLLFINGQSVFINFTDGLDAYGIADAINLAQITNVFAYVTDDHRLVVRLQNVDLGADNNKLNISAFNGNYFYELGIAPYTKTQVIREPHKQYNSMFGYKVVFNEQNNFVVSAPKADRYAATTFDVVSINEAHYNTVFDLNLTTFEDVFYNAGAVYMYDYLKPYNESLINPGQYVYAQPLLPYIDPFDSNTWTYGKLPLYGNSIVFNDNVVMIGSPGYKAESKGGNIYVFENNFGEQNWSIYRNNTRVVDVDQIQRVQLYNNATDENLVSLDYIDPLRGKLLGAVRNNLDFIGISDPAGYNNPSKMSNSMIWNSKQIGKTWFNTSTTKFLNYHQNDLYYNAKYWGQIFPGSIVTVYTWIESDVTPAYYAGPGIPYDLQKYTVAYTVNSNNGSVQKYYFWVRNTNTLYDDKTLTDVILERYITSPQNSGIAYMAPLRSDTYALYNVREYINGTHTNMHLGFSTGVNQSSIQYEFKLIQNNNPSDFLPGLPNYSLGHVSPSGLYNRLLESFAGIDETGASVPNYTLPAYMQVGIGVRPRQSMFIDRFGALKNYLTYANSILAQYPINEFSNLTYLSQSGDYFDTSSYWSNVYWWATGYDNKTKTKVEVGMYADLYKLDAVEGLIVGVSKNGQGKREVHLYTSGAWTRIGLQDGTIQFSNKLWDYQTNKIGFGDNFFDTESFDMFPAIETYYIIRALNEQIFTGPLLEHRNKSLILMFEYIQSENVNGHNYLPWLNKTSFADVTYTVRDLQQVVNYQQDNTTLLRGYINEVKPYHTVIKDFDLRYTSTDTVYSSTTDFDIGPVYNSKTGKFISPQLNFTSLNNTNNEYSIGDSIWNNSNYTDWYNNYGLALNGIPNFELGILTNYITTTSNTLMIDNARGMPDTGTLYIDYEIIGYNNVNRDTGMVSGLTRGISNSLVSEHYPGVVITTDLPSVVVLDTGRNYIDPPKVIAYIDTTKYPAPKREAILQPVMSGDKVISINVIDPGENYPVTPEIIFSSSYDISFTQNELNFVNDTIIINSTVLKTGDLIRSVCVNGVGSIIDGYYYVYIVATIEDRELLSITLHKTLNASLIGHDKIKLYPGTITSKVTGNEYIFSLTARAIAITTNVNVRGISNTLRFDRTSYISKVVPWEPNKFWGSRYNNFGISSAGSNVTLSETTDVLYHGRPYTGITGTVSPTGGTNATFTITNVLLGGTYNATLTNGGTNYRVFDKITIPGTSLSGTTPTNDCVILVDTITAFYPTLNQDYTTTEDHTTPGSGTGALFNVVVNSYNNQLTGALSFTKGSNIIRGSVYSSFTGYITDNILTATHTSGTIKKGSFITGNKVNQNTIILDNITGSGDSGTSTWYVSTSQTVPVGTVFTGVSSLFNDELASGSIIQIKDTPYVVDTVVTDNSSPDYNTLLTLTTNYSGDDGVDVGRVLVSKYEVFLTGPGINYRGVEPGYNGDYVVISGDRLGGITPENDLIIHVIEAVNGKITKIPSGGISFGYGAVPATGAVKTFTITLDSKALDSNFASLQGAVLPIQSKTITGTSRVDHGVIQDEYSTRTPLTGTLTVVNGDNSVTGTDTLFLAELYKGAILYINGVRCIVDTDPTNNTTATLVDAYTGNSGTYSVQVAQAGVIVRLDYTPSMLSPGQIQGAKTYFYHNAEPKIINNPLEVSSYVPTEATIAIYRPKFNPYDVTSNYYIVIEKPGTNYRIGDRISITGSDLGGIAGVNDATIIVTQLDKNASTGGILTATVIGVSAKIFDVYYVQPISASTVTVFHDPGMKRPVQYADFSYKHNNNLVDNTPINTMTGEDATLLDYNLDDANITDFAYIPEPFSLGLSYKYDYDSIVSYDNRIWRCIVSNNDTRFDTNKWALLESSDRSINALDRIIAYYEPAINMPAKDLQQLVRGISYPGSVYYGNSFSPEDIIPLDIVLKGQDLYPRSLDIKSIITNRVLVTGSLSLTRDSNIVNGNGTLFNKELTSGCKLYINDDPYIVDTVVNNERIILHTNYPVTTIISAYKFQYIAVGESTDHSILLNSTDGVTWTNHVLAEHPLNVTGIIYSSTVPSAPVVNDYIEVSSVNPGAYTLTRYNNGVDNKTLGPLYRGGTYTFILDSSLSDDPFYFTTDSDPDSNWVKNGYYGEYTTGVTGSRNNGTNDGIIDKTTITIVVPADAPDVLYYQSATDKNKHGKIIIQYLSVETNNKYLVSTLTVNNPMLVSYNGIDWSGKGKSTLLDQAGFDDDIFDSSPEDYPIDSVTKVIYGSDGFYYGVGTFITRSSDGIVWYKQFDFNTKTYNKIFNVKEVKSKHYTGFIAVGGGNRILSGIDTAAPIVTTCSIIITSIDGVNWELAQSYITTQTIKVVINNSDKIIIAGNNGEIWYGINGYNWTPAISGTTRNLTAGVYANSRFIVVGDYGTILTSTDGITWVDRTNNSLTIDSLNDVTYDGSYYYIVGNNATILKSIDGTSWTSINLLTPNEPNSVVAGNDFLYGYGPDELIPGMITDTLSIRVTTKPGSNWDNTPNVPATFYYQHTSFGMKSVTSTTNSVSFDKLLKNPAEVSVFLLNSTTKLGNRIYTGYTTNWITKTVTLTSLPANTILMVEVYDVGNGNQLARGNSQITPLRVDSLTGYSEIYLNQPFVNLTTDPVVYHNGVKLVYQTDYDIVYANDLISSKILFNTIYVQGVDYITWAVLDSSSNDLNDFTEIGYSIPETQIFTNDTNHVKILTNQLGTSNTTNMIVEKNGLRLKPNIDYTILNTNRLNLATNIAISTSDTIAVTTFNETNRLFLETMVYTATANQTVFTLTQPIVNPNSKTDVNMDYIYYTDVNKAWVTINGKRIGSDKLSYDNLNQLTINASISAGDIVIITVTIDGNTPDSTSFNIEIDKYGKSVVYKADEIPGSWLTSDFGLNDSSIHLYDVNSVLDVAVQHPTVTLVDSQKIAYVECDISSVRNITVYNQTLSSNVTSYSLQMMDGRSVLLFTDNQVSTDDVLTVTLKVGNIIELNGEKIRYTHIDFVHNTISGLIRGVLGTGVAQTHVKYSQIYGLGSSRVLDPQYYGVVWNSGNTFSDPLQLSTSPAATFLQYGHY